MFRFRKIVFVFVFVLIVINLNVYADSKEGKILNDIEKLRNVVKEEKYINLLKTSDIETISDIIETENLTPKQTNNLVKTWVTNNRYGSSDNIVQAIIKEPNFVEKQIDMKKYSQNIYYGDVIPVGHPWDCTGVHYQVQSNTGFNKVTGFLTLPQVNIMSNLNDPDVPNAFFGTYVSNKLGFDLGATYIQSKGMWQINVSGYGYRNKTNDYAKFFKVLHNSDGSVFYFSNNELSKVYFVAKATKQNGYDRIELTTIRASDWTTLGTISIDTNENDYYGNEGVTNSFITSSYSNCFVNREVTLSHAYKPGRPYTGTEIINAKWDNVYIYSPSGYSLWLPTQTHSANTIGENEWYARSVKVSNIIKWYEDICTILYK